MSIFFFFLSKRRRPPTIVAGNAGRFFKIAYENEKGNMRRLRLIGAAAFLHLADVDGQQNVVAFPFADVDVQSVVDKPL